MSFRVRLRLLALLALLAASPAAVLDHFQCYQTVRNRSTHQLVLPASLGLAADFETVTASPTRRAANFLCNPARTAA